MRDRHSFEVLDFQFYQKRMMQQINQTIALLVVVDVELMIMVQSELMYSMQTMQRINSFYLKLVTMMR